MSFQKLAIDKWEALVAHSTVLKPAESSGRAGCNVVVQAIKLQPGDKKDKLFKSLLSVAAIREAGGEDHVLQISYPHHRDPTILPIVLLFASKDDSRTAKESFAEREDVVLTLEGGRQVECRVFLQPAQRKTSEVVIITRDFPSGWGVKGVTQLLLGCAGYPQGATIVREENAGSLPCETSAVYPTVGAGTLLVAVVEVPDEDRSLSKLPRRLISPGIGINITIRVEGHGVAPPPPTSTAGSEPRNPFRQQYRARGREWGRQRGPRQQWQWQQAGEPQQQREAEGGQQQQQQQQQPRGEEQEKEQEERQQQQGRSEQPQPREQGGEQEKTDGRGPTGSRRNPPVGSEDKMGPSAAQRMGRDRRGLGCEDTPAAAKARAEVTPKVPPPPVQLKPGLGVSAGFADTDAHMGEGDANMGEAEGADVHMGESDGDSDQDRDSGGGERDRAGASEDDSGVMGTPGNGHTNSIPSPPPVVKGPSRSFMEGVVRDLNLPSDGEEGEFVDIATAYAREYDAHLTKRGAQEVVAGLRDVYPVVWADHRGDLSCPPHADVRAALERLCDEASPPQGKAHVLKEVYAHAYTHGPAAGVQGHDT